MEPRLWTAEDLAAYLRVPVGWVTANYQLVGMPAVYLGSLPRFRQADIEAWLQKQH
jgi:hypothetical protein